MQKSAAVEDLSQLKTQAMREVQSARKRRRYLFAVLRVRLPDKFVLQGVIKLCELCFLF